MRHVLSSTLRSQFRSIDLHAQLPGSIALRAPLPPSAFYPHFLARLVSHQLARPVMDEAELARQVDTAYPQLYRLARNTYDNLKTLWARALARRVAMVKSA